MGNLFNDVRADLLNPTSLFGALFYGIVFAVLAGLVASTIRRTARRVEPHCRMSLLLATWCRAFGCSCIARSGSVTRFN